MAGRVFLRGIDAAEYGLVEFREAQLGAARVRGPERELKSGGQPGYSKGSGARWRLSPGDDEFLTQTIQAHFTSIQPRSSSRGHGHQNEAAFYILQGSGYEVHDGQRYDWSTGDLVYVHTDSVHRHFNESDEPALALVVKAKATWMYFGLLQQGRETAVDDDAYGPREDWTRLWTPDVEKRIKVVKPDATPWQETDDGRVRWIAGPHLTGQRCFSVDVLLQEIPPGGRSGRRWQMADEIVQVLSGHGSSLQWRVEAEIQDRYYARIAKAPTRHAITSGDTLYVPQNHVRQIVNEGDEPMTVLRAQNRLFRYLGYDAVTMLESASAGPGGGTHIRAAGASAEG